MNMDFKRKLPIPKQIKEDFPISAEMEKVKAARDEEIKAVFEACGRPVTIISRKQPTPAVQPRGAN